MVEENENHPNNGEENIPTTSVQNEIDLKEEKISNTKNTQDSKYLINNVTFKTLIDIESLKE